MSYAIIGDDTDIVNNKFQTPVLLLVFNRPKTTIRVFESIRRNKPSRLYVAADGPRSDRPGEIEDCSQVRRIATSVDWPCEVKTLFRERNLGCCRAVSEAIDWFFSHEEEGIILEDDCVPSSSFFPYAEELLRYYRDDHRVMVIGAPHFHGDAHHPVHSYFFSRYNHCWGWASWRRAWQQYDREMILWPKLRKTDWLLNIGDGNLMFRRYWTEIFDRTYDNAVDSWAYRWTFSCWSQNGLTILPHRNLVTNIGFGPDATHTKNRIEKTLCPPLECLDFPLKHPSCVVRDVMADHWTDRHHFRISNWIALRSILCCVPGMKEILGYLRRVYA